MKNVYRTTQVALLTLILPLIQNCKQVEYQAPAVKVQIHTTSTGANGQETEPHPATLPTEEVKVNCATDPAQDGCSVKSVLLELLTYQPRGELAARTSSIAGLEGVFQYSFDVVPSAVNVLDCPNGCRLDADGAVHAGNQTSGFRLVVEYKFDDVSPQYYNVYFSNWATVIQPILVYSDGSWGPSMVNDNAIELPCARNSISASSLPYTPEGPAIEKPYCILFGEVAGGERREQGSILYHEFGSALVPNARPLPQMPCNNPANCSR